MRKSGVNYISKSAAVSALYIVLSLISNMLGLANGVFQLRLSEALCLLPVLFPESIWGLFVGCFISNILSGCVLWDIIFGSLATLLAAYLSFWLRKKIYLASLAPFLVNTIVIPFILKYAYSLSGAWWYLCLSVGVGEFIACVLLAPMLIRSLKKHRGIFLDSGGTNE